jgi:maleylacetate reductase
MQFSYQSYPVKVIFGSTLREGIAAESGGTPGKNLWIAASARYTDLVNQLAGLPGISVVHHFSNIIQHVPQQLVDEARQTLAGKPADVLLAIGGGSAIGLAKALAVETGIPVWAVPTTYSGSEMTNIYGVSAAGEKVVRRNNRALPEKVFYDPALSVGMPLELAATSAMNAMAHLVEALYSVNNNPVTYQITLSGIRYLYGGMQALARQRALSEAINEELFLGAYLAGKSLSEVSMGLHHKAAHVLGGSFGMDHSKGHTALLPYVFAYQWEYLPTSVRADFEQAYAHEYPPRALRELAAALGAPTNLRDIGFPELACPEAAAIISRASLENPAPVSESAVENLLRQAYAGELLAFESE